MEVRLARRARMRPPGRRRQAGATPLNAGPDSIRAFYDGLAAQYHLVYQTWQASIHRQGAALAALIAAHRGPGARAVHAAAVGIGTQALGLLALGFRVTGSDLSSAAVRRAQREAAARHRPLVPLVADFRALPLRAASVDVVIVCDN